MKKTKIKFECPLWASVSSSNIKLYIYLHVFACTIFIWFIWYTNSNINRCFFQYFHQFFSTTDPCWPQSFDWSNIGYPQSCGCSGAGGGVVGGDVQNNPLAAAQLAADVDTADKKCNLCKCMEMKTSKSPRVWTNNHFCFSNKKKDPKFQLIRSGKS